MAVLVGGGVFAGVSFVTPAADFRTRYSVGRAKQGAWDRLDPATYGWGTRAGPATPLYFYFADALTAIGSSHGVLTERALIKSTNGATGWTIGTNTGYALMQANAAASVFAGTPQPANPPTTNDCLRSENPYTGTFAAGTWQISTSIEAQALSGATIALLFRIWRSIDPTGLSGCIELTAGAVATPSAVTQSSPSSYAVSPSLLAASLNGEYLFLQIAVHSIGPGAVSEDAELMQNAQIASIADIITPVFTPGAVTSNADAAITLDSATTSSTATVDITASEASTLDALTLAATGTAPAAGINGALAVTLGAMTASSDGTLAIAAAEASTLGTATASSTGTLAIAASEASTLGVATTAATGTVAIAASSTPTLGALTASSSGTLTIAAAEASTLGAASSASAGTLAIAGSGASTLGALVSSAAGALAIIASESSTLGVLSLSSAGTTQPAGNFGIAAVTLDPLVVVSAGTVSIAAAESSTLAALSAVAAGAVDIVAASSATLGALTLQASDAAVIDVIPIIGGAGEYHEPEQQTSEVIVAASITLGAMTCSATATVVPIPVIESENIPIATVRNAVSEVVSPVSRAANSSITLDSLTVDARADVIPMPITRRFPLVERVSLVKIAAKVPRFRR